VKIKGFFGIIFNYTERSMNIEKGRRMAYV